MRGPSFPVSGSADEHSKMIKAGGLKVKPNVSAQLVFPESRDGIEISSAPGQTRNDQIKSAESAHVVSADLVFPYQGPKSDEGGGVDTNSIPVSAARYIFEQLGKKGKDLSTGVFSRSAGIQTGSSTGGDIKDDDAISKKSTETIRDDSLTGDNSPRYKELGTGMKIQETVERIITVQEARRGRSSNATSNATSNANYKESPNFEVTLLPPDDPEKSPQKESVSSKKFDNPLERLQKEVKLKKSVKLGSDLDPDPDQSSITENNYRQSGNKRRVRFDDQQSQAESSKYALTLKPQEVESTVVQSTNPKIKIQKKLSAELSAATIAIHSRNSLENTGPSSPIEEVEEMEPAFPAISPLNSPRGVELGMDEGLASPASIEDFQPSSPRGNMPASPKTLGLTSLASPAGSEPTSPLNSPREEVAEMGSVSPADSAPTSPPSSPREETPVSRVNTNLSSRESIEEFMKRLEKDPFADRPYDPKYEDFRKEWIGGQRLKSEKSQALDEAPSISETFYHLKVMPTMINGIIYNNPEFRIEHSALVDSLKQQIHQFKDNKVYELRVGKLFNGSFQFYFYENQERKAENFGSPIFLLNDIRGEISLDKYGNDLSKHKRTIIEKASGFYDPVNSRYEFTPIPIQDNLSRTVLYPELNFLMILESKMDKFSHNGNYSVAIQENNGVYDLFPMKQSDNPSNSNSKILQIPTNGGVKEIDLNNLSSLISEAQSRQIERQITIDNASLVRVASYQPTPAGGVRVMDGGRLYSSMFRVI